MKEDDIEVIHQENGLCHLMVGYNLTPALAKQLKKEILEWKEFYDEQQEKGSIKLSKMLGVKNTKYSKIQQLEAQVKSLQKDLEDIDKCYQLAKKIQENKERLGFDTR